jgi:hypothetical protein
MESSTSDVKKIASWQEQVIGQSALLEQTLTSVDQGTLSHAIIIEGISGHGGLPVALSLAQRLLCLQPDGIRHCGTCKACIQSAGLIHPDLHIVFPVVKKEGIERKNTTSKDFMTQWREQVLNNAYLSYNEWIRSIVKTSANGDINVTECNQVIQRLSLKSYSGGNQVQLIWIADRLGNNGNKLLKLIEEPPPHTFFILVVESLSQVLMTIQSRCRIYRLPPIDQQSVAQALIQHLSLSQEQADTIAYLSDGDFGLALTHAQLERNDLTDIVIQWFKILRPLDLVQLRKWSSDFGRYNQEEQKAILHMCLKILHAVLHHRIKGYDGMRLSEGDKQLVASEASIEHLQLGHIQQLSSLLSESIYRIERYVHARMVMFDLSLKMAGVLKASTQ